VISSDDLLELAHLERAWEGDRDRCRSDASPGVIQQRLLPRDAPMLENVECSALCRQAGTVGGDFFDFLAIPNGELGLAIGDVCGKGVGAALMMASLQATLRALVRHVPDDPAALIETANRLFHDSSLEELYATLFYATFDPATRIMKYVNAGHVPPMLVRKDRSKIEWLDCGGAPVGLFHTYTCEVGSITLSPGDVMVAHTDGVNESRNAFQEEWGVQRMVTIARACEDQTAIQLRDRIVEAVDAFAAGTDQRDDMTLLVLRAL
jgi:sigma-B regulation protein RsbU (phosphoserine phosphatase)